MEYAIGYVATIFAIQALAVWRTPREDFAVVFVASVFWPVMIVLVAGSFALEAIGWDFDITHTDKFFGFRKSPNPQITGYALALFTFEFQLFKFKR